MFRVIRSRQNPRVKQAALLRDARRRAKTGRIIIDGQREFLRACEANLAFCDVFLCPAEMREPSASLTETLARLSRQGVDCWEVTSDVFDKVAFGRRREGIVATAETPDCKLSGWVLPEQNEPPLIAVLDGLEKPGNLGAVLRTADGAGVSAVIAANPRTDIYNPNAIRASLGTVFRLQPRSASAAAARRWLAERNVTVYAARVDGAIDYAMADFTRPCAVVLGSEAHGLGELWRDDQVIPIRLPMLGAADSLNVSSTAAVLFYEARRQRQRHSSGTAHPGNHRGLTPPAQG